MNIKNKNKFVIHSVIGLAAISIGTIGFATWITGIDKQSESDALSINVDTSKNKTCVVEASLSDSEISLSEKEAVTGSFIKIEDGKDTDLTITFSTLKVTVSDYYAFNGLNFTLEIPGTDGVANCSLNTAKSGVYPTNLYREVANSDSKTYFELEKTSTTATSDFTVVASDSSDYIEGYATYTINAKDFNFKWGSLFENKKPSEYYQSGSKTTNEILKESDVATKTLNAMKDNLNGKKINLVITADVTAKA